MDIQIYGLESCGKCKIIKKKLEDKGIDFTYIDNEKETIKIAQQVGRRDLPLSLVDGKFMDYVGMINLIRDMEGE